MQALSRTANATARASLPGKMGKLIRAIGGMDSGMAPGSGNPPKGTAIRVTGLMAKSKAMGSISVPMVKNMKVPSKTT